MTTECERFAVRLNEILDEMLYPEAINERRHHLSQQIGIEPNTVGEWLTGESFPKTSQLVKLAQRLQVRSNWLFTGMGEREPGGEEECVARPKPEMELSSEAYQLALRWSRLPSGERDALRRVIEALSGQ